jgi:hypothetical protein
MTTESIVAELEKLYDNDTTTEEGSSDDTPGSPTAYFSPIAKKAKKCDEEELTGDEAMAIVLAASNYYVMRNYGTEDCDDVVAGANAFARRVYAKAKERKAVSVSFDGDAIAALLKRGA